MSSLLDMHVYTNNTPGTKDKISFLCETAVEKDIRGVAFTDIVNLDDCDVFDIRRRVRHSFFDISKAKQLFFDSLTVFGGIELRQAVCDPKNAEKIISSQKYDIVLTSISRFNKTEEFDLAPNMSAEAFNAFTERYCDMLLKTVNETDFDVFSRPLAPLRETTADYTFFEESMKVVLDALANREKALEIDTKDILGSERIRDLYLRLITYFKKAGGKYITIGSECISHDELGRGIELTMNAVRRAGFEEITFYDQRTPYAVKHLAYL
ncbi:MAG: hypothetical protein J1E34_01060 [Oscillospiraceae bacterium]|nr:hypothetical protein [Oscillospiraceae bacterium]